MERTCRKCGHVNAEAPGHDLDECPKCGAIYTRVEALLAQRAAAQRTKPSSRKLKTWAFLAAVLAVVAAGYFAVSAAVQESRARAERQAAADQRARMRAEAERNLESVTAEAASLQDMKRRWDAAVEVASSTSRIALAGQVTRLQDLAEELRNAEFTSCVRFARSALVTYQEYTIRAFVLFMGKESPEGMFEAARTPLELYAEELASCRADAASLPPP